MIIVRHTYIIKKGEIYQLLGYIFLQDMVMVVFEFLEL